MSDGGDGMFQMHDMGDTFDEALTSLKESLNDARRQLAAWSLVNFPHRDTLNIQAGELRKTLKASCVEINAITRESQVTVAGAPSIHEPRTIPAEHSLCVVAASYGKPLAVDDIRHDPVVALHPVVESQWLSWASAPIVINQCVAGTVCALEKGHARHWTSADQEALEAMAARIGKMINTWAGAS